MRRKRERSATAKSKASPEKKVEKVRRTRGRRRKQSTSSGNESIEEAIVVSEKISDPGQSNEQTTTKEESPQEALDQVWQVKTAEGSGDGGEIQKLKICLKRPPSTPEGGDRSPRSKRKHTRATSSSDSTSVDASDEKKKNKHRSKRSACGSSENSEKNSTLDSGHNDSEIDVQNEIIVLDNDSPIVIQEAETEHNLQSESNSANDTSNEVIVELKEIPSGSNEVTVEDSNKVNDVIIVTDTVQLEINDVKSFSNPVQPELNEVSTSSENIMETSEVKETSSDEKKEVNDENQESIEVKEDLLKVKEDLPKVKEDLSVVQIESTNNENIHNEDITENTDTSLKTETCSTTEKSNIESKLSEDVSMESDLNNESIQEKHDDMESSEKAQKRERSVSFDKSEILELHADESKGDISYQGIVEAQKGVTEEKDPQPAITQDSEDKVSKSEDKMVESFEGNGEPPQNEIKLSTNEPDVVAQSENVVKDTSNQEHSEESADTLKKVPEQAESSQVNNEGNGHSNIVINRKRRWGSRPNKLTTQKSITISTDVLKEIIPDVKPVEFEEVIEEKKHRRFEVTEKIERPILPKIVIDNTENMELKRNHENKEEDIPVKDTSNLTSNRKISIVRDSENAAIRPPSPPRHKQSNILYITNLVRPFTLSQLRNLLQRTGRITENGFWIDRIKSKCYVIYENEDQAVETRHALHGVTWPVSNPKTLHVDFSTQEDFDQAKSNEENESNKVTTIPGTVEDWLREQDLKREKGELDRPWERKTTREWDLGKNDKIKEKDKDRSQKDDRSLEKRRHHTPERSPEPAKKFKKKEEAPAKLLDDLFRKTKTTPCIYWLPLSAETIAIKEEQRRQHMAEHERRLQELRRASHRRH